MPRQGWTHTETSRAAMREAWERRRVPFWERVDFGDCWVWTGPRSGSGYGQVEIEGKRWLAHRYAYECIVGPIPAGLTLDHLCRNPICVNPEHLEPVSHATNILRGTSPSARYARRALCKNGHAFDAVGSRGERLCLTCKRARWREWNARRKGKVA